MEEEEAAGVRKRKRGGEAVALVSGGEAGLVEGGGGFSWKEAEMEEGEGEEYEGIAEESVEEVMRWLELEISSSPGKPGGGDDGFVTINGNEESCGPSFSAAASTVMASVDTRAGAPPPPTAIPWPWPEPNNDTTKPAAADGNDDDADMAELVDEEWLVELLTGGGPALEVE
ncbi:hypothetical protein CFC21_034319 [Triticum aestivum]|uniref:Uncharacterized protein n=3 Tax=Triticum TaxID=4564 RepID=A0A9R0RC30_TRITD|nr:uncharacterized protein LOC123057958 [Triticum aestivum]KAF7021347.1 hypothetical protein CFC21_034319 [Triticum aestivum]VAH57650.1 unnamed protein product [Triticum turgidum subsp. durum]